jgi:hypothetical protein
MKRIVRSLKLSLFVAYSILLFAGGWKGHETAAPLLKFVQQTYRLKP